MRTLRLRVRGMVRIPRDQPLHPLPAAGGLRRGEYCRTRCCSMVPANRPKKDPSRACLETSNCRETTTCETEKRAAPNRHRGSRRVPRSKSREGAAKLKVRRPVDLNPRTPKRSQERMVGIPDRLTRTPRPREFRLHNLKVLALKVRPVWRGREINRRLSPSATQRCKSRPWPTPRES